MNERNSTISRKTKETDIQVSLQIDGAGKSVIDTGVGFFDHMLEGFAKHGFFDLQLTSHLSTTLSCRHFYSCHINN